MKFLHCSDIHLGRRPVGGVGDYSCKRYEDYFRAFEWVVNTAIEKSVDAVIIAGDLFDRRELLPEVLGRSEKILLRLKNSDIPVLVIEGNHDNITGNREDESWIIYLEKSGLLLRPSCFYDENGMLVANPINIKCVDFYGLGYPGFFADKIVVDFSEMLKIKNSDPKKTVLLIHTAIGSNDFIPGTVSSDSIDLLKSRACYIAGGHIHKYRVYPSEKPFFFIPGAPEYWDFGERGERGVILFDTQALTHTFLKSTPREMIYHSEIITAENEEAFEEAFFKLVSTLTISKGESMVSIVLEMKEAFYPDIVWCEEYLRESSGALRAEVKLKYIDDESRSKNVRVKKEAVEEIEKRIIGSWEFWGSIEDTASKSLARMRKAFQEKSFDRVTDEFDSLIESVMGDKE